MTIATEAGHWYADKGVPKYEIVGKNGKLRPTTLRDARNLNLFPSVTMIMRCAAEPQLEVWKRNQLLMSALTLPRMPEEGTQAFAERVIKDSQEQAEKARDVGTLIHGHIEKHLCGIEYDPTYGSHVRGAVGKLEEWCGYGPYDAEKSFAHPLGYGGKVDVHKYGFVADFKTKDFTEAKLPDVYDNHATQLAAYREGLGMSRASCAIIYVSSTVPGLTHLVEIAEDELARGWKMFQALLSYWQLKNRYQPSWSL